MLETTFGRTLPQGNPIGESWEIVDRPEAQSVVAAGPLAKMTLRAVLEKHGPMVMGPAWPAGKHFPLLVKWLDCRERLSLQVHPPQAVAKSLGGEPKTENWYIANTDHGAQLIVGLKKGVTRAQFEKAIADNTLEACVHRFPVAVGDSILVQSGQVHAIDAGNLILEIQQNSDTTYRVFDWGRVGLDGKPRQLHIAESLQSILWDSFEPVPVRAAPTPGVIADSDAFKIRRIVLDAGEKIHVAANEQPRLLSVVSGEVTAVVDGKPAPQGALARGENVLLPYGKAFTFAADTTAIVLVTEDFA
jgi:mannose-6-phosphate isomerase